MVNYGKEIMCGMNLQQLYTPQIWRFGEVQKREEYKAQQPTTQ